MSMDAIRTANAADAKAIARLVNDAYRPQAGHRGWTHEAEFVAGARVRVDQIEHAVAREDAVVLLGLQGPVIIACVQLEQKGVRCHIGMLAVAPTLQGKGIAKQMLAEAERYALTVFSAEMLTMLVLSPRRELIDFYLRRGYQSTGVTMEYPQTTEAGIPRSEGLRIEVLEKRVGVSGEQIDRAMPDNVGR